MFDAFDDDDLDFDDIQDPSDTVFKPDSITEAENTNDLTINLEIDSNSVSISNSSLNFSSNPVHQSTRNVTEDDSEVSFEEFFEFAKEKTVSPLSFAEKGSRVERRLSEEEIQSPIHPKEVIHRVKRQFPGPAGVIPLKRSLDKTHRSPRLSKYNSVNKERSSTDLLSKKTNDNELVCCSQSSQDVFQKKPWLTMKRDLQQNDKILAQLDKFNIADILKKARRNLLPSMKAPLLCVLLQSINFSGEYASAVFRDPSGEISGWVDRLILKEYGSWFQPGCVLVLRQTSVLSVSLRKHYLNVHPTNIVQIYRSDCDDDRGQVGGEKTISNQSWNDLIREAEESLSKSPNVAQMSAGIRKANRSLEENSILHRLQSYSAADSSSVIEDVRRTEKSSDKRTNTVQRPQLRATSKELGNKQRPEESSTTFEQSSLLEDDFWNDDEFDSLLEHVDNESQLEAK